MFAVSKDTASPNRVTARLQSLTRHLTDMNTIRMAKSLTVLVYIAIRHSLAQYNTRIFNLWKFQAQISALHVLRDN
jgi:hypothetical protein